MKLKTVENMAKITKNLACAGTKRGRRIHRYSPASAESYYTAESPVYSTSPYFTLIRSSFSSMGWEIRVRVMMVAAACTQSRGKPIR